MADIEEIRKKVDKLITEGGFNYRELSLKIGRKDSYIQQYVKYGYPRRLKEIDRIRLAKILNVDDSELMDDEIIATKANSIASGKYNIISDIINNDLPESNLEVLDILNPQPENSDILSQVTGKNFIARIMLNDLGISNAQTVKMVKITSDSMKPVINPGDYVWFDSSCRIPVSNGLYLFLNGREFTVRRVEISPLDNSVEISCDNTAYKTYTASKPGNVKTLGRIIALTQKL